MSENFTPDWFSPPGSTIAMIMARQKVSTSELAARLRTDVPFVLRLIAGTERIEVALAELLAANIGATAAFWTSRQTRYDAALDASARNISSDDAREWLRALPIKDMRAAGWITSPSRKDALQAVLAYFGVTSPGEWRERYAEHATSFSYRTSQTFESKLGALAAWLRQGELQAAAMGCAKWDPQRFSDELVSIRGLTRLKKPFMFINRLRTHCASAGVAVVFVKAPVGCRASGATRFIGRDRAMIVLSFRHLSDDHFWFSFFHEAGHLLMHGPEATFIDGDVAEETDKEKEANAFAAGLLIPIHEHDRLLSLKGNVNQIVRFAVSLGISPGIVVGQMQHHGILRRNQLNGLKRRYKWEEVQSAAQHINQ
ncbi:ImmA/IrrE family metallo-endopeptidase [Hyphomicrobium sp. DMF-1]|jgi:Zn-dependent peptidase ImmA (M78 family)/plasmid maintenance system antidote protein VapI|uniref:ImmA/IrrE family metallo-endopeptidase n=1 Tax=Hyphomicrobium sp. DMF-1 TaxID=3019544 RepID=UPI0022EBD1A5|nr:ImmA/IrrE family metallo-endopeptidase [Hyphomicrobium sp. DMF-1]WBT37892.1 ImmA/IrrE family metallo-endopeptidase [Hyphomicrobium sp. DMF-1]